MDNLPFPLNEWPAWYWAALAVELIGIGVGVVWFFRGELRAAARIFLRLSGRVTGKGPHMLRWLRDILLPPPPAIRVTRTTYLSGDPRVERAHRPDDQPACVVTDTRDGSVLYEVSNSETPSSEG